MITSMLKRKAFSTAVLGAFVLGFSGCVVPFIHKVEEANTKVSQIQETFNKVDEKLEDVETFSQSVLTDGLTASVMESNKEDAKTHEEELETLKEELEATDAIFAEIEGLTLPADYVDPYLANVKAAKDKRLEAIDAADGMLFKAQGLASAIVDSSSAISRLENVVNLMGQVPEVNFEDPTTIKTAQVLLEEISSETKLIQTEFNDAAASVSVEVFTKLRDSAGDLGNMAEASDQLVDIYEALLVAAQQGDEALFLQAYEALPVQLEVLVASLEKFVVDFPDDLVDDNGDFTTKAENMVETWKDENLKAEIESFEGLHKAVEEADETFSNGYQG